MMNLEPAFSAPRYPAVPLPQALTLVWGAQGGGTAMLELTARLALRGPVYVLDCGNRADMYHVAKRLRLFTADPVASLRNIRLSRAFTCYQVAALLEKLPRREGVPVVIFELLSTFLDEDVEAAESQALFEKVLRRAVRLSRSAAVVVSVKPLLSISSPRQGLLDELMAQAFQVWEVGAPPPPPCGAVQETLFADFRG